MVFVVVWEITSSVVVESWVHDSIHQSLNPNAYKY